MLYLLLQSHYTLKQTLTQLQSTGIWFLWERGFREMWFLRESGSCISWVKIRLCPWFPARIWWNMPVALLGEHSPMLVYQHSSHSVGLGRIPAMGFSRTQVPLPGGSIWRQPPLGRARTSSMDLRKTRTSAPAPREEPPEHKQGQLCSGYRHSCAFSF